MIWQRCKVKIVSHPRLEVGKKYIAWRDESGEYYVDEYESDSQGGETVFRDEAEEVPDDSNRYSEDAKSG